MHFKFLFRFAGGRLSMCYNAVDRHVNEGRGGQRAIVWDSPISGGHKSELTYSQLQDKVSIYSKILHGLKRVGYLFNVNITPQESSRQ